MKQWLWLGMAATVALVGCGTSDSNGTELKAHDSKQREIQPVKKLGTDASVIAQDTARFLQQAERVLLANPQPQQLKQQVFQPAQQLLLRWNTEIKQGDSVVGDQYTICRGALIALDSWARSVQQNSTIQTEKRAFFKRQQGLCDNVLRTRQSAVPHS